MEDKPLYIAIERSSLLFFYFLFIDCEEHLAERVLRKRKVPVRFLREYTNPQSRYRFIRCRVRKREVGRFQDAMTEFINTMLLCGYPNYLEDCAALWREFMGTPEEPECLSCAGE